MMLSRTVAMALKRPLVQSMRTQGSKTAQQQLTLRSSAQLRNTVADVAEKAKLLEGYSMPMKLLHWGVGAGIAVIVGTVNIAQQSKDKKLKGQMMMIHKSTALLTTVGIISRVAIRLASKIPPAMPNPPILKAASTLVHYGLYAFMIVMPTSGIAMGYFGGKGLPFFGMTIPGAAEKNGEIAKTAYGIHKQAGYFFQGFLLLHVGGSLFHVARGEAILARMNPFI